MWELFVLCCYKCVNAFMQTLKFNNFSNSKYFIEMIENISNAHNLTTETNRQLSNELHTMDTVQSQKKHYNQLNKLCHQYSGTTNVYYKAEQNYELLRRAIAYALADSAHLKTYQKILFVPHLVKVKYSCSKVNLSLSNVICIRSCRL